MTNSVLRYELKYVAPAHTRPHIRALFNLHPQAFRTQHASRQINSLYLDSPTLSAYQDNVLGASRRQKLRLRWYGDQDSETTDSIHAQLELKRKDNILGDKLVVKLPQPISFEQTWRGFMKALRSQLSDEWKRVVERDSAEPTTITQYHRDYLVSVDDQIRITLDYNQKFYDQRMTQRPNLTRPNYPNNTLIIELKAPRTHAPTLDQIANTLPFRRTRNSKYSNSLQ